MRRPPWRAWLAPGALPLPVALAFAVVCAVAAIALRLALDPLFGDRPALIALIPPIIVVAYIGGLWPGLLATALIAVGAEIFLVPPRYSLDIERGVDFVQWFVLVITGILISLLLEGLHRGRRAAPEPIAADATSMELKIRFGFATALAVICVISGLSYYSINEMVANAAWHRHSMQAIEKIIGLGTAIKDIDTGVGRFVITGTESNLLEYRTSSGAIERELGFLAGLLADNPAQTKRVQTIAGLVKQRIAVAETVIAARRRSFNEGSRLIASGEGKRIVDRIRSEIDQLQQAENVLRAERQDRADHYAYLTRITIILGGGLGLLLIAAAVSVVNRDFAGRRRAEAALREANDGLEARVRERTEELADSHSLLGQRERQFSGIVGAAMDAIVTVDERQHIVLFNAAAERIFGHTAQAMLGQPLDRLLPARFREGHRNLVRNFGTTSVTNRQMGGAAEIVGLRADGSEFPLEASISQVSGGEHKLLTAILRDITDRKRAETALRESEKQLRLVTDEIPALISYIDDGRRYRFVNRAYEQWWARPREQIIGRPVAGIIGGDLYNEIACHLDAAFNGKAVVFDSNAIYGDGVKREVRTNYVPDTGSDGHTRGIFVLATDITEQKRTQSLLQRTEKMEALGTLAGGIAHDFNNILPAIIGYADAIAHELPPAHPAQPQLAEIDKASRRASDLVRRILAFSRPQEKSVQNVTLETVAGEALKLLRSTLPATIELRSSFSPDMPPVQADPTQVYQIVVNLITNAAQAIGQQRGLIELRIEQLRATDDPRLLGMGLTDTSYAVLTVSDNGPGMDTTTAARIFDPFFTTKPAGHGTGLGLSIVHGIMKNLGGAVTVYSEPGKGARFRLYFPLAAMPATPVDTAATTVPHGNARILYLDDEEPLVFLAGYMLRRLGYTLTGMTSATEALRTFAAQPSDFDVVVSDLSMPGMSGFDFAREVLAIRPDVPVVVTSGYIRPEDEECGRRIGVRAVIEKPNTMQEYAAILDTLLRDGGAAAH